MPRARNAIASTATRTPRIVTTRTPLFMRRDGVKMELIWGKCEAEYFCRAIWTTQITLNWLVKFVVWRSRFCGYSALVRLSSHQVRAPAAITSSSAYQVPPSPLWNGMCRACGTAGAMPA